LVTGHLPDYSSYFIWGLIGASILADAEHYLFQISDDTKQIKEQMEDPVKRVKDVEQSIHDLDTTILKNN
jgi:hypothetical protein